MKIACILVIYNPDHVLLKAVLETLTTQVTRIIALDNSTNEQYYAPFPDNVVYIPLGGNRGIAHAQNQGIEYVLQHTDCQYILFMDQDSIAPADMVEKLSQAYTTLQSQGIAIGGIGAQAINRQNNKAYSQSVVRSSYQADNITEVREIMSSASLIATERFRQVGRMDEALFIDGVDWEWCWRAKARYNLRFFVCSSVALNHYLGQGDRSLAGKNISISSPFRIYYQYRNYLVLCRRQYVPLGWKLKQGAKYIVKLIYYPLFVAPRKQYLRQIFKGIKDGLRIKKQ